MALHHYIAADLGISAREASKISRIMTREQVRTAVNAIHAALTGGQDLAHWRRGRLAGLLPHHRPVAAPARRPVAAPATRRPVSTWPPRAPLPAGARTGSVARPPRPATLAERVGVAAAHRWYLAQEAARQARLHGRREPLQSYLRPGF